MRQCRGNHISYRSARHLLRAAVVAALLPVGAFAAAPAEQHYRADLMPLNASVGGSASGSVKLTVGGGTLTIAADVKGLSPGVHMIHIHGFTSGDKSASCAGADQDANHDGIIDLVETGAVSGTTLIPFNGRPIALNIGGPGYPKANAAGEFIYWKRLKLRRLEAALKQKDGIEGARFDKWVIYVHGVPDGVRLPASAQSLPGVPPRMTLPVACGVIRAQ
jgi:hypothetical protein